jgi:hypothetical protein
MSINYFARFKQLSQILTKNDFNCYNVEAIYEKCEVEFRNYLDFVLDQDSSSDIFKFFPNNLPKKLQYILHICHDEYDYFPVYLDQQKFDLDVYETFSEYHLYRCQYFIHDLDLDDHIDIDIDEELKKLVGDNEKGFKWLKEFIEVESALYFKMSSFKCFAEYIYVLHLDPYIFKLSRDIPYAMSRFCAEVLSEKLGKRISIFSNHLCEVEYVGEDRE